MTNEQGVLEQINDEDYRLADNAPNVWVMIDGFSVYLRRTDEGIVVDILKEGDECAEPSMASCYAFTADLEDYDDD